MIFRFPGRVKSNFQGYGVLVDLYDHTRTLKNESVEIDFSQTWWFEANLCAGLGAILADIRSRGNTIMARPPKPRVAEIFAKNGFSALFGAKKALDIYSTTIPFKEFLASGTREFVHYLDDELLSQPDLPKMSDLLKKKINKSIFEIFNNSYLHGGCRTAFSCGQYYPREKRLDFTIADMGHTIRKNVRKYLGESKLSGTAAIRWAVEEGNTTRQGDIPGGLGFSLIREFLKLNEGKIQVVSSDGYWEEKKGVENFSSFPSSFVGTIVNMEFNINDYHSYSLTSELNPSDIF